MAKKKKYKGTVISPFGFNNKKYNIGDVFETEHEESLKYLITTKRIK